MHVGATDIGGPYGVYVRRRPTLPRPRGRSTIGAERLNFRVRDGTGCFPFAMAAVTLAAHTPRPLLGGGVWPSLCSCVSCVCSCCLVVWLVGCGREPHRVGVCRRGGVCVVARCHSTTCPQPWWLWGLLSECGTSPRPISTGRLGITAVHLRPINPVFCWGPYPVDPVGNLILKRASRLDAFSGYHFRT